MAPNNKRRPRGEGSITHKGDRWVVGIHVNGRHMQRTVGTQREAIKALAEMKQRPAEPADAATVADVLDAFLAHGQDVRHWTPSTVRSYRSAIDVHLRPALGRKALAALGVADVDRLIQTMLADGHAGRHVAHVRGVLRAALTHAMRRELVHRNVAQLASPPRVRRGEMSALSVADMRKLFAALDGHRLRALFVTAASLGLRRGELIAIRWADVDLDAGTLTVRRTGSRIGKQYIEGQPKSAKSRRTVSLPGALVNELRRHRAALAAERLRLGPLWADEDRVFPGSLGGPVGETTIRKTLNAALEGAGLAHVRVHDLRHTAASALLKAGGAIRDVQEMLGHSSYALTADLYTHILDEQRRATADRIDGALGGAIAGKP